MNRKQNIRKMRTGGIGIMRIGTRNVRGTNEKGAVKNLVNIMRNYKLQVLALQETKQKGKAVIKTGGCTLFNSGDERKIYGTGFLVSKEMEQTVIDFKCVSENICSLRPRGMYHKISIINVHAATEDKDMEIKTYFYETVMQILDRIPKFDVKIVLGNFNAKVG